jgi:predicted nucleotidyltransferase
LNKDRVLTELRDCLPEIRARGVRALYLFGSTARGVARDDSDIDMFIEPERADRFNAFDLIDVKLILEQRLDAHVDLTTHDGLHPRLKEQIEREALQVF